MQGMNQKQLLPTSQKLHIDMNVMKKLIEELEKGKNSIHIVRSLILQHYPRIKVEDSCENNQDYYKDFNHHSMVALDSYHSSISMLKNCTNCDGVFVEKRKFDHLGQCEDVSPNNSCISGVSANQESYNLSIVDNRREFYKKRKISCEPREEEVTHLTYDGFGWRKYGQKMILNYQHPRHYYRCTHKPEQNCQATKQIQQVSDNPTKYKLIYYGNHTCNNNKDTNNDKNILKTSSYMIDSPVEHSSSIVLNFGESNQVNPSLFPTSSYSDNRKIIEDAAGTTNARVPIPLNHVYENWSTTASPIGLEEEYFTNIIADFSQLSDLWTV